LITFILFSRVLLEIESGSNNKQRTKYKQMKKSTYIFPIITLLILIASCQSLFEEDISEQKVTLLSPPDGHTSYKEQQKLWWSEVEGASKYKIQVVSPNFEYMGRMLVDSFVSQTEFDYTFYPDTFAWRVKAVNEVYETEFTSAYFIIDSSPRPQEVSLRLPANNLITNSESITFKWLEVDNVDNYRFFVNQGEEEIFQEVLFTNSISMPDASNSFPNLGEGIFQWQVRSENENGWSEKTSRNLTIDRTAPSAPIITKPSVNNDSVTEFSLAWYHPNMSGTAVTDSLLVFNDSLGTREYLRLEVSDTTFTYSAERNSWYVLRVKSVDAATNEGPWSKNMRFYLKEESNE
jgi:hypothetical protein